MGPGAIVIVGSDAQPLSGTTNPAVVADETFLSEPFSCVDVLGRSILERTVDRLIQAECAVVNVLVSAEVADRVRPLSGKWKNVRFQSVSDVAAATRSKLRDCARAGIEQCFVMSAAVYAETDFLDLFHFHRESRRPVTRSVDREGPLDLWVVNCDDAQNLDFSHLSGSADAIGSSYFIREYVKRVGHPRDLRQLAVDMLQNRCAVRPPGRELKPGVWIDERAEVHRRARIVAPAYIGRGSKVRQDALVTRCSSIEENCCIDCGTVVEDSSILANTHVGIWLDVCHAIAAGNLFLSLNRDVALEIADSAVIRINSSGKRTKGAELGLTRLEEEESAIPDIQQSVALEPFDSQLEKPPASETWQLGANPIQG